MVTAANIKAGRWPWFFIVATNNATTKTNCKGGVKSCTRYVMEFVMKRRRRCFSEQYDRYDTKPAKQMYEYPESDLSLGRIGRTLARGDVTPFGEFFSTAHEHFVYCTYTVDLPDRMISWNYEWRCTSEKSLLKMFPTILIILYVNVYYSCHTYSGILR